MTNFIIILLIFQYIKTLIIGNDKSVLCCGIWGFSSKRKDGWNALSRWKFQTLGVEMDSRGGDGCGIAFDNTVHKSENILKFDEFWRSEYVPNTLKFQAIIGHDRKASVGGKTFDNTQPICFTDGKNTVCSILAHNGTLYNHKELYKKHKAETHYDLDTTLMSDSQMLALLIDRIGWGILGEYIGSVSMLYMNTKECGSIYAYHGKSPSQKGHLQFEERPLFYAKDNGSIWLCSTRSALEKIVANKENVIELPFNKVFKITGDTIKEVYEVDRSQSFQNEPWNLPNNSTTNIKKWNSTQDDYRGNYNKHYDSYENDCYDYWGNMKSKHEQKSLCEYPKIKTLNESILSDVGKHNVDHSNWRWVGGLSVIGNEPIHGMNQFARSGRLFDCKGDFTYTSIMTFYFWKGNLVKGRSEWQEILKLEQKFKNEVNKKEFLMRIAKFFVLPYIIPKELGGDENFLLDTIPDNKTDLCDNPYYGIIHPVFTCKEVKFIAGRVSKSEYVQGYTTIEIFEKHKDPKPLEFLEWEKNFLLDIKNKEEKNKNDLQIENAMCPEIRENFHDAPSCVCKTCGGSDLVLMDKIREEAKFIRDTALEMLVISEEAKITLAIVSIVDEGIEALEEPEFTTVSTDTYFKLKTIKEILADGRYCDNV
jgi:hypothetical protein